jgi:hypothetical protein
MTMSFPSRRRLQLVSVALGVTLVLAVTPIAAQASVKNPTTKSVLAATQKALAKVSGVHINVTSKSGTKVSTVVVDIGSTYGQETIKTGASTVKIIVTPTDAYLRGSKTGLTTIMGLTAAEQKKVGKLSIVMKAGTTPYESFQTNLTTAALAGILPATKGTTFKVGGGKQANDYQLTWKTAASSTSAATKSVLTISSGSKALPVKEVITSSGGGGTTTFSKWNENVVDQAPAAANTVPYAKVIG